MHLSLCLFLLLPILETISISSFRTTRRLRTSTYCNTMLSDDEVERMVETRIELRRQRDYEAADLIMKRLEESNVMIQDVSYKHGGGTTWRRLKLPSESIGSTAIMDLVKQVGGGDEEGIANIKTLLLNDSKVEASLREMQGRKFADCAFTLAMNGVRDEALHEMLKNRAKDELLRFGARASCRAIDVVVMAERLAVSGTCDEELFRIAASILSQKPNVEDVDQEALAEMAAGSFSLLSKRAKACLWRHSKSQAKFGLQKEENARGGGEEKTEGEFLHADALAFAALAFADPSKPLIIDCGCGYGVSLLGLCKTDTNNFNYLGFDMSPRATAYANAIASRWHISHKCCFIEADCAKGLAWVLDNYEGETKHVFIQFPSPFRLVSSVDEDTTHEGEEALEVRLDDEEDEEEREGGNIQLPHMDTFMFSKELLLDAEKLLSRSNGFLLLQSNAEDVAIAMKALVEENSLHLRLPNDYANEKVLTIGDWMREPAPIITQRQHKWITSSDVVRACGEGYLDSSPLPECGKTETEVVCELQNKRVFRSVFQYNV